MVAVLHTYTQLHQMDRASHHCKGLGEGLGPLTVGNTDSCTLYSLEDSVKRQAVDDFIASGCFCTLVRLGTSRSKQLSRAVIAMWSRG